MKRVVTGLLIGLGTLALSTGAFAQDYGRARQGTSFQGNDRGYWDRERLSREYRTAFYDRLQGDLSRAEKNRYLHGEDLRRFDRAHKEVGEFSAKWSRGIFDPREMDQAISAVQRVVEIPALHRDDRDALRQDVRSMRDFRSRMGGARHY